VSNDFYLKKRKKQVQTAVDKMTSKQLQVCTQLQIPPQDYIIIMNKIHI
jgi:hypothetical protein